MQAKKKRLTLDMDPAFQRRLKATAALKGVSMRQYCLSAIDRELVKDQLDEDKGLNSATPASNQLHDKLAWAFGRFGVDGRLGRSAQEGA